MMEVFEYTQCSVIATQVVEGEAISAYGVLKTKAADGRFGGQLFEITDMVEKPKLKDAPSNLAVIGRYILTPDGFRNCANQSRRGRRAATHRRMRMLLQKEKMYGYVFEGKRHDAGDKLGFLKATVEFALKREDLGGPLREYLKGFEALGLVGKTQPERSTPQGAHVPPRDLLLQHRMRSKSARAQRRLQLLRFFLHAFGQFLFMCRPFSLPVRRRPAPRICAARIPALVAPGFPIATVATGIPAGICTVASSESIPCNEVEGIGTPITGSVVCAAITPARCAAPPAPAMITRMPRSAALRA